MKDYLYLPKALSDLRKETFTLRAKQYERLHQQCRLYTSESLPCEHPMKSITYFGMAASNLSLAFLLTEQTEYLDEARRWLSQGVAFPHWGRAVKVDVDLSAAWLLFGFGLSYNWISDFLPVVEKQALLNKLVLQGERMYDYAITHKGDCWVTNYWQNHNWIDFTGLAVAGYAIRDEYPLAQNWIDLANSNMAKVFPLLADDGSDYEGIAYWRYGVIWLALYADLAKKKENINYFKQSNFLRNTFFYRIYQSTPDFSQNFNFGDCHDTRSGHTAALYFKLASEYNNGYAQDLAEKVLGEMLWREAYESKIKPGILPEAFLEFLWYDSNIERHNINSLPTSRYFEDLGLYSTRSSWQADALAFSMKCSSGGGNKQWQIAHNLESKCGYKIRSTGHHHPDANSFILVHANDFMVIDEGYSSKKMTAHHNIVLVDNCGYANDGTYDVYTELGADKTANMSVSKDENGFALLCAESSKLYKKDLLLELNMRETLCADSGYFVIADTLKADKPHIYSSLLHFEVAPKISNNTCTVQNGLSQLMVYYICDDIKYITDLIIVSAIPTSQEPSLILTCKMHELCIQNKTPTKETQFLSVLYTNFVSQNLPQCSVLDMPWGKILIIETDSFCEAVIFNTKQIFIDKPLTIGNEIIEINNDKRWQIVKLNKYIHCRCFITRCDTTNLAVLS